VKSDRRRQGFSIIELLVVIVIFAIMFALILAGVQRARSAAARMECANRLRQIGLALHHYHDIHRVFPTGVSYRGGKDPYPFMSWNTRLLPFLEQANLWKQTEQAYAQDPNFLHNPPHVGLVTVMPIFTCPADSRTLRVGRRAAFTSYLGVAGDDYQSEDGMLYLDSVIRLSDVRDGTSNTLMVGERPPSADEVFGWWYAGQGQSKDGSGDMVLGVRELNIGSRWGWGCPRGPYQFQLGGISNQCDAFHFWSLHPGGAHFLFVDGSVHFLSYSAASILPALATRAGGEAVTVPE